MKTGSAFIITILLSIASVRTSAQCTGAGVYPESAIELCNLNPIVKTSMSYCNKPKLFNEFYCTAGENGPEDWSVNMADWYKFTCYQAGYLVINIEPDDQELDFDFVLYDITGKNPEDVYTAAAPPKIANWSYTPGTTGAWTNVGKAITCQEPSKRNLRNFSAKPLLILGHKYLLVVVNASGDGGYTLSFNHPMGNLTINSTASVTNPAIPKMQETRADCNGSVVKVSLNRSVRCSSLAADGSDFILTDGAANIYTPSSAYSRECSYKPDFDTLALLFSPPLSPGNYTVKSLAGTDGNTLIDNCGNLLPAGDQKPVTITATPLNSFSGIVPLECKPNIIEVKFARPVLCSSIDINAGEVYLTGPANLPVYITDAGFCNRYGITGSIKLFVFSPILVGGDYTVHIRKGPDGNTFLDECGDEMPLSSVITFHVADTVDATFQYSIDYTCTKNTVLYAHNGAHDVNIWNWTFDTAPFQSNAQQPLVDYTDFQDKLTSLFVSNGTCKDSVTQKIVFANYMKAGFEVSNDVCPEEKAVFVNTTVSNSPVSNWRWEPGNGNIINAPDPGPQSFVPAIANDYAALAKLTVTNSFGCSQSVTKKVVVHNTCFIAVPAAFTPNGDGLNDYLYPLKAFRSTNMTFNVYNHYGQLVFHGSNWEQKWDGKIKGVPQETGTYVWMLQYTDTKTGEQVAKKGTTILLR